MKPFQNLYYLKVKDEDGKIYEINLILKENLINWKNVIETLEKEKQKRIVILEVKKLY